MRHCSKSAFSASPIFPVNIFPPVRSGGSRWRDLKLSDRPLWLLDEPLASLDAAGKKLAADLIAAHCASGGIVIAATHEPLGIECAKLVLGGA